MPLKDKVNGTIKDTELAPQNFSRRYFSPAASWIDQQAHKNGFLMILNFMNRGNNFFIYRAIVAGE
jgi:hypothetical protein